MTAVAVAAGRRDPLVAVICSVPVVFEGLRDLLETIATVRVFPADEGEAGLLRLVAPDAVIVDSDEAALRAEPIARELGFPLVHLCLRQPYLRVFENGNWHQPNHHDGVTAESVRNVVAGGLYGRRETN
jgi:hypothetical protein